MPVKSNKLEGVVIAIPTPLKENEDIDIASLKKLLDYCITEGANAIMVSGTMGEGAALVDSQKTVLVETAVGHVAGRIPVLAAVSAVSTRQAVEYARSAEKSGADYIVSTTPFYYKFPEPESLILHARRIADNIGIPFIFYNAAGCTGNPVTADICDAILNLDNVAGIKDSGCNYNAFIELLRRYPDKNTRPGIIMQGDESVIDSSLMMGADGLVSGGGVCFIRLLVELYEAAVSGNRLKAFECQQLLTKQMLAMLGSHFLRDWMFNIKNRLYEMGVIEHPYVIAPFLMSRKVQPKPLHTTGREDRSAVTLNS